MNKISPKPAPSPSPRQVKCPRCGKPALYAPENRWRPFCSEHCYTLDLGAWASDSYRIGENTDPDSLATNDNAKHNT